MLQNLESSGKLMVYLWSSEKKRMLKIIESRFSYAKKNPYAEDLICLAGKYWFGMTTCTRVS